jgi:2-beta-glucuronyltransferase
MLNKRLHESERHFARDDNVPGARAAIRPREFLFLSGHDYRSKRKANVHFIASSLRRHGRVNCYSIGFSSLSRIKHDPRAELWSDANRVCEADGIGCYLERNLVHPFNTRREWLKLPEALWFAAYKARPRPQLWKWVRSADTIILESGISIMLAKQIAQANPRATKIYLASDDLTTIGCSDYLLQCLDGSAVSVSYAVLPSRLLAPAMPGKMKLIAVPHGLDQAIFAANHPSPYSGAMNAVSVGSMLFDAKFFEIACRHFPDVKFHIIGGGQESLRVKAENAVVMPEMPFSETVRYIAHASIGIAPYVEEGAPYYLADTSMKLMQYQAAGINAVCPSFADGGKAGRFGYDPGREESIVGAIRQALDSPRSRSADFLSWDEVTDRILSPSDFPDTNI